MKRKLDKTFLHEVLMVQSKSGDQTRMQDFILNEVIRLHDEDQITVDCDLDMAGNIYLTRGRGRMGYPAVVAHMDTVHPILPDAQFQIRAYGDTWHGWNPVKYEMTGIGGDDKVGVYIALEALRTFKDIKVAFFTDEEWGCQGSAKANMQWFEDVNLVLQADRQGNTDFVTDIYVELSDKDFQGAVYPHLVEHGYVLEPYGGITDVGELKEKGLQVAAANLSAGYWNPHSDNEYVVLKDVQNCMNLMFTIIEELGEDHWYHESKYTGPSTQVTSDWSDYYRDMVERCGDKVTVTLSADGYFEDDTAFHPYRSYGQGQGSQCCIDCGSQDVEFDIYEYSWFCHTCGDYMPQMMMWEDDDEVIPRPRVVDTEGELNGGTITKIYA